MREHKTRYYLKVSSAVFQDIVDNIRSSTHEEVRVFT